MKKPYIMIGLVIFLVTMIVIMEALFDFSKMNEENEENKTQMYLEESSSQSAKLIQSFFKENQHLLMVVADFLAQQKKEWESETTRTLLSTLKENSQFETVFIIDESGVAFSQASLSESDYLNQDYFQKSMKGEKAVSNPLLDPVTNKQFIFISVPIMQETKIVGVLVASYETDNLDKIIDNTVFNGEGYVYLIRSNGNYVAQSERDSGQALVNRDNFFALSIEQEIQNEDDYEKMRQNMKEGKSGFLHFSYHQNERYLSYAPTKINDWYLATIIPKEVVDSKSTYIKNTALILSLKIMSAFLLLVLYITYTLKRDSRRLKRTNQALILSKERYQIVVNELDSVIFEWHLFDKSIDFENDFKQIFESKFSRQNFPREAINRGFIYFEDQQLFEKMEEEIRFGKASVMFDFRLDLGEHYYWHRINARTLYNENDVSEKVIGVIQNVHEKKLETEKLKNRAETDPLTGLYNKTETDKLIKSILIQDKEDTHALFFFDVDDFKNINDTYGHALGDRVLIEIAKVLKNIFRNNDVLGRVGGDEFVVFIKSAKNKKDIIKKAEALREAIESLTRKIKDFETLSVSIGIARYPKEGKTYEALYEKADEQLYKAKALGKNKYAFDEKEEK